MAPYLQEEANNNNNNKRLLINPRSRVDYDYQYF